MVQGRDPSVKDLAGVLNHDVPYLFQKYVRESHGRDMRVVVVVSERHGRNMRVVVVVSESYSYIPF